MVLNMLELSNRGLWSEHWIPRDLIECMFSKLNTTFDESGYVKRLSKKYIKYSKKTIQRIYDQCKKKG